MARGQKGAGSVFQRTYRDAHGRLKRTKNWYIEYIVGGRTIREATAYGKRSDAIEFLKKRVADGLNGKIGLSNQVTFDDLKNLIINDYRNNAVARAFLISNRSACPSSRTCSPAPKRSTSPRPPSSGTRVCV